MVDTFKQRQIDALQAEEKMLPLCYIMAHAVGAHVTCTKHDNVVWEHHWLMLLEMCIGLLPRGGGFDDYPKLDREVSREDFFVFTGSYHAMDQHGSYIGWRDYRVTVKPSFVHKLTVRVTGAGGAINEYIHDMFHEALTMEYDVNKLRIAIIMRETVA